MNYLLRDLDFVRCYQDDILVLSASHEQHLQHLRELLTILKRARLFVNWEKKCQIGRSEVVFAGYLISERGFEPPAAKVEAIARFPKPSDSTQLRRFIGMLNFYRRCLPRAAELMSPLTDLLRGLQKKKEKLAWSAQADEAFERIKQAMASAVRSAFYHPGQPLALHTDASNTAIGAALSQRHADDDWTPLGFFSQKLSPTQQRYSTYDRELLAIFEAIKYFQRILEGRSFTIMTDHRPLSFALEQKSDKFSPRQSRQLDFISRFDAKIVYTPGDENPNSQSGPEVLARDTVDSRTSRRPPRPTNYLQRGPASVASGDGFRHVATHTRGVRRTTRTGQNVAVRVRFGLYGACFKQLDQCQRLGMFSIARSSSRTWQRATTCFVGSTPFSSRSSSRIPDHTESSAPHQRAKLVVDVNGVAKTLSTDQLKPAYLDVADSGASQATPEQPTTTQPSSTRESHLFTPCANCPVH
ncbi:unnamed protein product [Trichogramma brassicae]|uniref:RNA-directed DNA polymerase n=1 Tax=Trichogramma brassicae TaxID=86971 RepID=A0A6H5J5I6_9HYME|nr:unnamed protein product [Trichogramma brassicae]